MTISTWRWPILICLTVVTEAVLFSTGVARLRSEARCVLAYEGNRDALEKDLKLFQSGLAQNRAKVTLTNPAVKLTCERAPGHPAEVHLIGVGLLSKQVAADVTAAAAAGVERSLARQKEMLRDSVAARVQAKKAAESVMAAKIADKAAWLAAQPRKATRVDNSAKIRALEDRRKALIAKYPTHSDIPMLARQIRELHEQSAPSPSVANSPKGVECDRQINEAKVRLDYFARLAHDAETLEKSSKPLWRVKEPAPAPRWPIHVEGWPIACGLMAGVFVIGFIVFRSRSQSRQVASANGLWKPKGETEKLAVAPEASPAAEASTPADPPVAAPVELKVVPVEAQLPSDPLTEKAVELYAKWVEVCKVLYAPATEAPQGIIESVGPLLQESIEFLPKGHDTLTRSLAQTVTPGDLPAHVARTVLMTLTGAEDAGVSADHRLAMALAALFHDLAVVPRPAAVQDEVGSDVGRLSATVLRRIPGLDPDVLMMVEEILIGMDEFKLETWQNVATGTNLEPLSKVLREIDRFEKVMQKQKARLDRKVANQ